jgi:NAD(P)-dependent dehydrogenase (short-subunit alcohol dehydrogenase family)
MAAQGGGRIVSTSMTLHYRGWPMMAHATAAKAGVDALTRTLAVEWAPQRIRVNAIAPGFLETELSAALSPERRERVARRSALGRLGLPDDIVGAIDFLASPRAGFITGQVLTIDGG